MRLFRPLTLSMLGKFSTGTILIYVFFFFFFFFFFFRKIVFEISCKLSWRQFAWNVKTCFLGEKCKKTTINSSSAEFAKRVAKFKVLSDQQIFLYISYRALHNDKQTIQPRQEKRGFNTYERVWDNYPPWQLPTGQLPTWTFTHPNIILINLSLNV